jgi:hypothetical protein
MEADRKRLADALLGVAARLPAEQRKELEQMAVQDVADIEPIIDQMLVDAFNAGRHGRVIARIAYPGLTLVIHESRQPDV